MEKELIKISKYLAYILRHHPEKAGIALDFEGFADLGDVLYILNKKFPYLKIGEITIGTLKEIIKESDKKRYEINERRIRAFYGHSVEVTIKLLKIEFIPEKLYHGTTFQAYMNIKEEGLLSKGRQYVHLSDNIKTAKEVARRRTTEPVILEIDAKTAKVQGIKIFKSGDMYLAEFIHPELITRLL